MKNFGLTYTLDFVDELSASDKDKIYNEILKETDKVSTVLSISCEEEKTPVIGCKLRLTYKISFITKEKLNKEQTDNHMMIVLKAIKDYKHVAPLCLIAPIK